jgi:hypothetical protein
MQLRMAVAVVLVFGLTQMLHAQEPPVRTLSRAAATTPGTIKTLNGVRQLPSGRVLVNDAGALRLLELDSTLTVVSVVAENAAGAANKYGAFPGVLMPYLADSTILVDFAAKAFVVIDPKAKIVRTMAPPRLSDISDLLLYSVCGPNGCGAQGFDPKGRLVYRVSRFSKTRGTNSVVPDSGTTITTVRHDSTAVVRSDPETRTVDTVAFLAQPAIKTTTQWLGRSSAGASATNPLPVVDEWTLCPDGTIVVVRAQDYHIEWIDMVGHVVSSPKMVFDWRRLTTEEKQRVIDSTKKAEDDKRAAGASSRLAPRTLGGAATAARPTQPTFSPDELPDYYPPIRAGQVKADPDGNIWLLPTTSKLAGSGLLFDVVNRNGVVVERVRLPAERNLVGFGPGGIVYMSYTAAPGQLRLERARVIR